jgi:hypothetical protein
VSEDANGETGATEECVDLSITNCAFFDNKFYGLEILTRASKVSCLSSRFSRNLIGVVCPVFESWTGSDAHMFDSCSFYDNEKQDKLFRSTTDSLQTVADNAIKQGETDDIVCSVKYEMLIRSLKCFVKSGSF